MAQRTRVVIRGQTEKLALELMEITHVESLSELVAVMFSRYGEHLKQTWRVKPADEATFETNDVDFNEPLSGL